MLKGEVVGEVPVSDVQDQLKPVGPLLRGEALLLILVSFFCVSSHLWLLVAYHDDEHDRRGLNFV
jgi:hypothetical protein